MKREMVNDNELEKVVGGTIIFSEDCSTCGYFCKDQYKVLDFDSAVDFILKNKGKMSERSMLSKMVTAGYLTEL